MFRGQFSHTVDPKGRLSIPAGRPSTSARHPGYSRSVRTSRPAASAQEPPTCLGEPATIAPVLASLADAASLTLHVRLIEGESTDKDHKGEIDVLSWSWGESQEIAPTPGGGSCAEAVTSRRARASSARPRSARR